MDSGNKARIVNVLKALSSRWDITFVGSAPSGVEAERSISTLVECFIPVSEDNQAVSTKDRIIVSIRAGEAYNTSRVRVFRAFESTIGSLDLSVYDKIWVVRRDLWPIFRGYESRTILDLDDIEHKKVFRLVSKRRGIWSIAKGLPRVACLVFSETIKTRRVMAVLVCSDEDRQHLRRLGAKNVKVLRNGTDIATRTKKEYVANDNRKWAVFIGNLLYAPNMDAVRYFEAEIAPLVRRVHPDFLLSVVGSRPFNTELLPSSVDYVGFVQDLGSELTKYRLSVAPLRFGGGTKLKVIDTLASGTPLVTTSIGAEGLGIINEHHALIADAPAGFADAILCLLSNDESAKRLADAGMRLAEERYGWDSIRDGLVNWLEAI